MDKATREFVIKRAGNCCEYCLIPQAATPLFSFHVEHIIAKQHLDEVINAPEHLALACHRCNCHKGTNLSSIDPMTVSVVALFHPRNDVWTNHFSISSGTIIGETPVGRATVRLLQMNAPERVELRQLWRRLTEDA